jgi:ABC-2 type transport system permease protein
VVGLSALFWCGLFWLFHEGLQFLVDYVGGPGAEYHARTVRFIFHMFFASLNVMLVFSAAIIVYGGLFASPETRFLLSQPVRAERIVLYKFQEAVLFSSWGFFLLASPLAIAYGMVADAMWYYYALALPLILAFVYIPCGLGAFVCLLLMRILPRLWRLVIAGSATIVIVATSASIWQSVHSPRDPLFGAEWFETTVERFRPAQSEWLPSSWLTNGLLEAAQPLDSLSIEGPWELPYVQSCLYLAVLISNALVCHFLVVWSGRRWFRLAFSTLECRNRRARRARVALIDRAAEAVLWPLPSQVRLLLVKDWRLLRRDPVQWSQFLIFFGLLGLYFLNIDRFSNKTQDVSYVTWVNLVSFLNLAVVGLILSTFTTRFIYPMLSLEGRRFWVLGLMPVSRRTIVLSKFVFASIGSWIPCSVLVVLSDLMLRVPLFVVLVHQLTTMLLCFGLAAIAVGLGAMMPDFRESSPSKIAAGFGGTLNLVLSALYIIVVVVLTALPCHFYLLAEGSSIHTRVMSPESLRWWLVGGAGLAVLTGVVATVAPLRQGIRAFEALEFQ